MRKTDNILIGAVRAMISFWHHENMEKMNPEERYSLAREAELALCIELEEMEGVVDSMLTETGDKEVFQMWHQTRAPEKNFYEWLAPYFYIAYQQILGEE